MTGQEWDSYCRNLEEVWEYFENYNPQEIFDTLVISGIIDTSSEDDLTFAERLARKLYYDSQSYKESKITPDDIGNAWKAMADAMGHKEKPVEYKLEYNFSGKTVKEVFDELSDEWRKKVNNIC